VRVARDEVRGRAHGRRPREPAGVSPRPAQNAARTPQVYVSPANLMHSGPGIIKVTSDTSSEHSASS
jgi:hypothetical protein